MRQEGYEIPMKMQQADMKYGQGNNEKFTR
jgi:hypothetical protein